MSYSHEPEEWQIRRPSPEEVRRMPPYQGGRRWGRWLAGWGLVVALVATVAVVVGGEDGVAVVALVVAAIVLCRAWGRELAGEYPSR